MGHGTIYGSQILIGGLFIAAGSAKLAGMNLMVQEFEAVGLSQSTRLLAGLLEVSGGLCLLVPRASALGAALVSCVVAGMLVAALASVPSMGPLPNGGRLFAVYAVDQVPSMCIGDDAVERTADMTAPPGWDI